MSRFSGGLVRAAPLVPSAASAKGIWTVKEAMQAKANNAWPSMQVLINVSGLTKFGNMTNSGGNAAAFDLNTSTYAQGLDNTVGFVGVDLGSAVSLTGVRATGRAADGFGEDGPGASKTLNWRGSNTAAPTNTTEAAAGALIVSITGTNANGLVLENMAIAGATAYRWVWVTVPSVSGGAALIAEAAFWSG